MPSIATLDTTSNALDTAAKFVRLIGNEGVTMEQFRLPIDDQAARRNLALFLKNGCQFTAKGSASLVINRAKLPTLEKKFIGRDWGEAVEHDERSFALTEIDFSKAVFGCPLCEGERYITGEEKLTREKKEGNLIRLDFYVGAALFQEKNQATLRFLHDTLGVTWMEFTGTVLRRPGDGRYFLNLFRRRRGSWNWDYYRLDYFRDAAHVSVCLAS